MRSKLQWAGHVERMVDDILPKRAAELGEQGRRRRGRPIVRWEDRVKRDVGKAGEEEDYKKKTGDRGGWKILSDETVKRYRQHLTPDKRKQRKRERERESERERVRERARARERERESESERDTVRERYSEIERE